MSANVQAFHTLLRNFRNSGVTPSVMLLLAWSLSVTILQAKKNPNFEQL
jgi:hypothetical protein